MESLETDSRRYGTRGDASDPALLLDGLQSARCLWLTGLSASGKSTIANLLEKRLVAEGRHTYLLDGDNVCHGLNRDLGFTEADRVENIRRMAEVSRLMVDAGLVVIVAFISAKALRGGIRNFTGVDSPYERPERPDLRLDTGELSPEECVEMVLRRLD